MPVTVSPRSGPRSAALPGLVRTALAAALTGAVLAGAAGAGRAADVGHAAAGGAADDGGPWRWPIRGQPEVTRGFDPPAVPWGRGHRGVDLAASQGEPVVAAGQGRVLFAGMLAGRGVVSIVHGSRRTTYEPVTPGVRTGQTVAAGDRIGAVGRGRNHCFPRSCLHWGLRRGDRYLDPLRLTGDAPVRLLPVWGVPLP